MFFIDKYSPKEINDAYFHKDIINQLMTISKDNSIPHLIFYGPPGSGKRTLVRLFLQMLYGDKASKLNNIPYNVVGSGNSSTEVFINQSDNHIVIEPNNTNFDRYLIHDVVKSYAKQVPIDIFVKRKKTFKIVLINNIDNLSYYAQTSLRRTMEIYSKNCRFILISQSLSKVIDPLISRCLCFRVNSPSDKELFSHLRYIGLKENIQLSIDQYTDILCKANGNIKKAIWDLQLYKYEDIDKKSSYEKSIEEVVKLLHLCDLGKIYTIRKLLYNISITNIDEKNMIKDILNMLLTNPKITLLNKYNLIEVASTYEHMLSKGRRPIMHLEVFIQMSMKILLQNKKELDSKKSKSKTKKVKKKSGEQICKTK